MTPLRAFARAEVGEIRDDRVSARHLWLVVFISVATVYLCSAHWVVNSTDAVAAAWPAWTLVHQGTIRLDHAQHLQFSPWFQHVHGHIVSSRMPGVVFIGVPVAAILAWTSLSPMDLSIITAALVTAAAIANVALILRRVSTARAALVGTAVLAASSVMWNVAGAELWTHGPDALWLTSGLLALASRRQWLAGVLLAPAVLTRPHLAVAVAAVGALLAWSRRDWRLLPALGVPAGLAVVAIEFYNRFLFGHAAIGGGTYSYAAGNIVSQGGASLTSQARDLSVSLAGNLVSPLHGLVVYVPAILFALAAVRSDWRSLPDWSRAAAIGGVCYLVVQSRINDFHGGYNYYGNRLGAETLLLCTPVAFAGAALLWNRGRRAFVVLVSAATVLTGLIGAMFGRVVTLLVTASPWTTWTPGDVLVKAGWKVVPVGLLLLLLGGLLAARMLRSSPLSATRPAVAYGDAAAAISSATQ